MTKKKFNEEKIFKAPQEVEGDITVREVCRKHRITEQTFYCWRIKFGSMTVLEVRRLKELQHDNAQRKQIVADLTLDNRVLRDVNQKSGEAVGVLSNGGLSQIQLSGVSESVEHGGYYRSTERHIGTGRCPRNLILNHAR